MSDLCSWIRFGWSMQPMFRAWTRHRLRVTCNCDHIIHKVSLTWSEAWNVASSVFSLVLPWIFVFFTDVFHFAPKAYWCLKIISKSWPTLLGFIPPKAAKMSAILISEKTFILVRYGSQFQSPSKFAIYVDVSLFWSIDFDSTYPWIERTYSAGQHVLIPRKDENENEEGFVVFLWRQFVRKWGRCFQYKIWRICFL